MRKMVGFAGMLALVVAFQTLLWASEPQGESKPVTGDWNFVLTPLDANGNAGASNISLQMSLQENASMVYATCCGGERLFGHRDGKDLHLQFLSHGVTDRDIKAGCNQQFALGRGHLSRLLAGPRMECPVRPVRYTNLRSEAANHSVLWVAPQLHDPGPVHVRLGNDQCQLQLAAPRTGAAPGRPPSRCPVGRLTCFD